MNNLAEPPERVFRLPRSEWGLRDDNGLDWLSVPDTAAVAAHHSTRKPGAPLQEVSGLPHTQTARRVRVPSQHG
jgi:hypothetical protein